MACFALTVLVTPYGWYTWVFAIAAAILPYIAVVFANAVSPTATSPAESPVQQLTTSTPAENSAQTKILDEVCEAFGLDARPERIEK